MVVSPVGIYNVQLFLEHGKEGTKEQKIALNESIEAVLALKPQFYITCAIELLREKWTSHYPLEKT